MSAAHSGLHDVLDCKFALVSRLAWKLEQLSLTNTVLNSASSCHGAVSCCEVVDNLLVSSSPDNSDSLAMTSSSLVCLHLNDNNYSQNNESVFG